MTTLILMFSLSALFAQEIAVGTASISKADRTCVIASYTMPADIIRDALSDKLKKAKIGKGSKVKGGFRVYKGVNLPEIAEDKVDLYTKVSGKRDKSTLYVAVSRGYDNFITPETDAEDMEKIKVYVQSMIENVNIAKIKVDIASQAKVVKKAEDNKKSKLKTGENLVSDQKNLEAKLARNKNDQAENKKDVEQASQKLQEEEAQMSELKSKLQMMLKN